MSTAPAPAPALALALARLDECVAKLETVRGSRVLLLVWQDGAGARKFLEPDDVELGYECLRRMGHVDRLDVVLHTAGGSMTAAAKLASLLAASTDTLSFLVPLRARSAGTLLTLAGAEIVMGPLAELGPLDPRITGGSPAAATGPPVVSAEEIRTFRAMATDWFGVGPDDGVRLLETLCARIFPTTLTQLYRADAQMRHLATRLLEGRPDADQERAAGVAGSAAVAAVVDRLVAGYHGHDEVIDQREAAAAGLPARPATPEEADHLWDVWRATQHYLAEPPGPPPTALMLCHEAMARHTLTLDPAPPGATTPPLLTGAWQLTHR